MTEDVASYLGPDRIGKYSFVGDNEIRFNPPGPQFDAVMMMDCSQCPIHPQLGPVFHEYAQKHSPVGNAYTAGLPADVALHQQQAAWDTVKEYEAI